MDNKSRGRYNGYTEARARCNKAYLDKFARVSVRMTFEQQDAIKAHAQSRGESVNAFMMRAALATMGSDNAGG